MKSPHDLWMHIFWKFVNIRVLLSIMRVYLHEYFEGKHKPRHLSEFWKEHIHFILSVFFHNWLSCEFKRLTQVWKIELFRLYMHDNLISRVLICLQYVHSFDLVLMWNKIPQNKFWKAQFCPEVQKDKCVVMMSAYFYPHLVFNYGYLIELFCA